MFWPIVAKVYFCGQSDWQMNLLAFFETLEIDRSSLKNLDENGLIRIEKQVHLQRKLDPDIDMNLANAMVSALRNDGRAFRFVLENRRLFNFFTSKIHPVNKFDPQSAEAETEEIQAFIDKYLRDDLMLAIDKLLIANQYEDLDDILEEKDYFPEDAQFAINRKLQAKVDFAIGKYYEKKYQNIHFLKFRTFYNCLSHFSSVDTDKKIRSLLSVTADDYNAGKNKDFSSSVMIAMSHYKTEDEDLEKVLISNYAIMTAPDKTGKSWNMNWRVLFFVVFFLIKIMVIGSKCSNDDNTSTYNNISNEQLYDFVKTRAEMLEVNNENFRDYLTAFDSSSMSELKIVDTLKSGQNPFRLGTNLVAKTTSDKMLKFSNDTPFDVILVPYAVSVMGKSYYIKKGESVSILASTPDNKLEFRIYSGSDPAYFKTASDVNWLKNEESPEIRFRTLAVNSAVVFERAFSIAEDVVLDFEIERFMLIGNGVTCENCIPSQDESGKRINRLN